MGNRRQDVKALALMITTLVITGATLRWLFRRTWTEHDVSDPGVTL
jgi:hypothetical protein